MFYVLFTFYDYLHYDFHSKSFHFARPACIYCIEIVISSKSSSHNLNNYICNQVKKQYKHIKICMPHNYKNFKKICFYFYIYIRKLWYCVYLHCWTISWLNCAIDAVLYYRHIHALTDRFLLFNYCYFNYVCKLCLISNILKTIFIFALSLFQFQEIVKV